MRQRIKIIQDAINSKPCSYCGKTHKVELNVAGEAISPVVFYKYSEDCCEYFKESVKLFVTQQLSCGRL